MKKLLLVVWIQCSLAALLVLTGCVSVEFTPGERVQVSVPPIWSRGKEG